MVMACAADLNKQNAPEKVIDYLLISLVVPPFDGEIVFASCCDDPERSPNRYLADLRCRGFLFIRKVDRAAELSGFDAQIQDAIQVVNETLHKMCRRRIAAMDQRIVAGD